MAAQTIPREEWTRFFDSFSADHRGAVVTLEACSPALGDQEIARGQVFRGISADQKDGENRIEIMMGAMPSDGTTHAVVAPERVWLNDAQGAGSETLEITALKTPAPCCTSNIRRCSAKQCRGPCETPAPEARLSGHAINWEESGESSMNTTKDVAAENIGELITYGQRVYDCDGNKVGTVALYDTEMGWMAVQKGAFVHHELYIPFSAVSTIDKRDITLTQTRDDAVGRVCQSACPNDPRHKHAGSRQRSAGAHHAHNCSQWLHGCAGTG